MGSTSDLKNRLIEHNNGKVISTRRYMPWNLVYYEAYIKEKFARMREKRLKHNGNAITELKKRIGLLKSGAGFTLIELLLIIAIIGVLAGTVIVFVNPAVQLQRANDARRKSDLSAIQKALEVYYNDNNSYPASALVTFGSAWVPYMGLVPQDPKSPGRNYVYARVDADTYRMYASLERPTDTPSCGGRCPSAPAPPACGARMVCNFGTTSPNTSP